MEKAKRKKRKTFTRRDFLKSLGGGAISASVVTSALGQEAGFSREGIEEIELYSKKKINLKVNGKSFSLEVEPRETLLEVIRERLKLRGTKKTCNRGECGACTVLINGKPVYSCHYLAINSDGQDITTVEGLAQGEKLHPVQQAFIEKDGYQCGFCTPGFIMSSVALLNKKSNPSLDEIKNSLSGNLCRCGNYQKIYEAVAAAAQATRRV